MTKMTLVTELTWLAKGPMTPPIFRNGDLVKCVKPDFQSALVKDEIYRVESYLTAEECRAVLPEETHWHDPAKGGRVVLSGLDLPTEAAFYGFQVTPVKAT